MTTAAERIAERIRREGPIGFDAFVDAALYGEGGFFASGHGAGRGGRDFVTSPEVGSLFGALVARALDGWWDDLGTPDPYLVVEAGAGRGRLAADVLAATPRCAPALRYVLVERSDELRVAQRDLLTVEPVEDALGPVLPGGDGEDGEPRAVAGLGPIATQLAELPAVQLDGVVLANELLDNLPFRMVERTAAGGWAEVRVALDGDSFVEAVVPASPELTTEADHVILSCAPGVRLPVPTGCREWLRVCASILQRGRLVVVDYIVPAAELVARGVDGWVRTYRGHQRGTSPLDAPGTRDVTADVPLEYLVYAAARAGLVVERDATQADWLRDVGIDALVEAARAGWDARAHVGDLEAVTHRSRVTEAAALTDPTGLGAHRVLVFRPA